MHKKSSQTMNSLLVNESLRNSYLQAIDGYNSEAADYFESVFLSPRPSLRGYQKRIIDFIGLNSAIVILPNGAGKTRITSEVLINYFRLHPATKVLFLVSSTLLVRQQCAHLKADTNRIVSDYYGGTRAPAAGYQILVSTPAAFHSLSSGSNYDMFSISEFGIVVFDEVHHCLQKHPYQRILDLIQHSNSQPVVIGLSASITNEIQPIRIKAVIEKLMLLVGTRRLCSASMEELKESGFEPFFAIHTKSIKMEGSKRTSRSLPSSCSVASNTQSLHGSMANHLTQLVQQFEAWIELNDVSFTCPRNIPQASSDIAESLSACSSYVHKILLRLPVDAWETLKNAYSFLEHFYEALKIQSQSSIEMALWYLDMAGCFAGLDAMVLDIDPTSKAACLLPQEAKFSWCVQLNSYLSTEQLPADLLNGLIEFYMEWIIFKSDVTTKVNRLKHWLVQQFSFHRQSLSLFSTENTENRSASDHAFIKSDNDEDHTNLRCIVYVKERITSHILHYCLSQDDDMSHIGLFDILYPASIPATLRYSLSKVAFQSHVERFARGEITVLISTFDIEDSMEILEAHFTIQFDASEAPLPPVQYINPTVNASRSALILDAASGLSGGLHPDSEELYRHFLAAASEYLQEDSIDNTPDVTLLPVSEVEHKEPDETEDFAAPIDRKRKVPEEDSNVNVVEVQPEVVVLEAPPGSSPLSSPLNCADRRYRFGRGFRGADRPIFLHYLYNTVCSHETILLKSLCKDVGGYFEDHYTELVGFGWRCNIIFETYQFGNVSMISIGIHPLKRDALKDACGRMLTYLRDNMEE